MIVAFTLSMPNNNAWDGRWSGDGECHAIVKTFTGKREIARVEALFGNHYYNFGDGWGANVNVREVASRQAAKLRKASVGFNGYEWMIDSLLEFGKIGNSAHQAKWRAEKEAVTA